MKCEQVQELLEEYTLGLLDPHIQAEVEAHLTTCADCRRLADEYAEIVHMLPSAVASASPLRPPAALKMRLLEAIDSGSQSTPMPASPRPVQHTWQHGMRSRLRNLGSIAAALLLTISAAWIVHLNTALQQEQGLRQNLMNQTELIFDVVDSGKTTRLFLRASKEFSAQVQTKPPYGKVFVNTDLPQIVAMTGRMPQPPAGQVYRLWLFSQGKAELAGTLNVDDKGFSSSFTMPIRLARCPIPSRSFCKLPMQLHQSAHQFSPGRLTPERIKAYHTRDPFSSLNSTHQ